MPGAYTPWEDVSLPDSNLRRKMRINKHGKHSIEIRTEQDCADVIELNTKLRNRDNFSGSLWAGRQYVKIASIPLIEVERMLKEEGINLLRSNDEDKARLARKLNDPSFSKWRTAPGRV